MTPIFIYGGQYLLLVPELDLVVVALHDWRVPGEMANQQKMAFTDDVFDPLVRAW